jgi:predicted translin family RNA/ssDNA-binding protein
LSTTTTTTTTMPSPPYQYRVADAVVLDLTSVTTTVSEQDSSREAAYALSRNVQAALVQARWAVEQNLDSTAAMETLETFMQQILMRPDDTSNSRTPRAANWSSRVEDYLRLAAYKHFLETATLLPPVPGTTDEEYLGGACMGLAQDLSRYGLGRATARDAASVQTAAALVAAILEFLLQLDFRNGPLRRKYDGTKYSLKNLETLLYELTVTGAQLPDEPANKRLKTELLPVPALEALKARMEHRDELRESIIKKSRDGQKAAKQSIFALHRGDVAKAVELLKQCHDCITDQLLPIVQEEPPLRSGSFANVLEEYVEAKLFMTWIYGKDVAVDEAADGSSPVGLVLLPKDFDIALEPEDYLGGLFDLTGEVGRLAVQRGTARDVDGVKLCLQTNSNIYTALQTMDRLPGGIGKKMGAARQSVEKLERMLYEMSLSQAAGGRSVQTQSMMEDTDKAE